MTESAALAASARRAYKLAHSLADAAEAAYQGARDAQDLVAAIAAYAAAVDAYDDAADLGSPAHNEAARARRTRTEIAYVTARAVVADHLAYAAR